MNDSFQEIEDEFSFVQNINATNIEEIQSYLDESIKANCEGLMVKMTNLDTWMRIGCLEVKFKKYLKKLFINF